jgi:hydroxyethylthiazole kinase-like uncharacterized protein yjeF
LLVKIVGLLKLIGIQLIILSIITMKKLTPKYIQSHLKVRAANSNKRNYGHALIVAGKKGTMGAALIAAKAAIRSGLGLLTINVPEEERTILQCVVPEAMLQMREEKPITIDSFSAISIGPGLGIDKPAENLLIYLLSHASKPLLLDADAISILSSHQSLLDTIPSQTIITPHENEFDRLFGQHQNNDERIKTAGKKAKKFNIIIVLKSHRTAIISSDEIYYNYTGNAGLAKGGSGDALTGIITSFLAQGYAPIIAASMGVYIHGLAADITLKSQSMESMLISDVIDNIGKAFKQIQQ